MFSVFIPGLTVSSAPEAICILYCTLSWVYRWTLLLYQNQWQSPHSPLQWNTGLSMTRITIVHKNIICCKFFANAAFNILKAGTTWRILAWGGETDRNYRTWKMKKKKYTVMPATLQRPNGAARGGNPHLFKALYRPADAACGNSSLRPSRLHPLPLRIRLQCRLHQHWVPPLAQSVRRPWGRPLGYSFCIVPVELFQIERGFYSRTEI